MILIFRIAIFQILSNPFEDIVPRVNAEDRKSKDSKEEKVKSKSKATKYAIYCHFWSILYSKREITLKLQILHYEISVFIAFLWPRLSNYHHSLKYLLLFIKSHSFLFWFKVHLDSKVKSTVKLKQSNLWLCFLYRNYKLLSFGDEAEEQEEEVDLVSKDSKGKGKSSHDLIDDPTLSAETTEIDSEEVRQRLAQPPKVGPEKFYSSSLIIKGSDLTTVISSIFI